MCAIVFQHKYQGITHTYERLLLAQAACNSLAWLNVTYQLPKPA